MTGPTPDETPAPPDQTPRLRSAPARGEALRPAQGEPYGDEVRLRPGITPGWLRWANYALYLSAIAYMVVNRGEEGATIVLTFAGVTAAWLAYIFLKRRPPEP